MNWSRIAACLLGLAVILGAFGVHGLKSRLDGYQMGIYEKAVFYHFIHGLGILFAATTANLSKQSRAQICSLFAVGILLFSGSLYCLALSGVTMLGAFTPFGGAAFIAAWMWMAWKLS